MPIKYPRPASIGLDVELCILRHSNPAPTKEYTWMKNKNRRSSHNTVLVGLDRHQGSIENFTKIQQNVIDSAMTL